MVYIIDTNIYRNLLEHFPKKGKAFQAIWNTIEEKIEKSEIISVDECYNELTYHYSEDSENFLWIKQRKKMFLSPTNQESLILKELFQNTKMQESIHQKNLLNNRPSADAYLAAKAKVLGAVLVTKEKYKQHSAQLPNICEVLGVKYINYDDFMAEISE